MTFNVLQPIKVRTRRGVVEMKAGQSVNLPAGSAAELMRLGKIEPAQVEDAGKPLMVFIYSHLLRDMLTLVRTDKQAQDLRQQGVEDVIYTAAEVHALRGKTPDEIRAAHTVKRTFPGGRVQNEDKA